MLLVVMALPMMVACGDDDEKDSTPDSGSYSSMTKYDKQKLDSLAKIYGKTYTVSLDEAGSLEYKLSLLNVDIKRITGLQISGKMNGSDIKYLHYLNNLVVLDMSESQIVDGGSYMFYDYGSGYSTKIEARHNVVTKGMFRDIESLEYLALPKEIFKIEKYSIGYHTKLKTIVFPKDLKSIEDGAIYSRSDAMIYRSFIENPFQISSNNLPESHSLKYSVLYVPKGTKEKYQNTDGWKLFPTIIEM